MKIKYLLWSSICHNIAIIGNGSIHIIIVCAVTALLDIYISICQIQCIYCIYVCRNVRHANTWRETLYDMIAYVILPRVPDEYDYKDDDYY